MNFIRIAHNPSKYIRQEICREEFVRWQTFYPSFGFINILKNWRKMQLLRVIVIKTFLTEVINNC